MNTPKKPLLIRVAPAVIILYAAYISAFALFILTDDVMAGAGTVSIAEIALTRSEVWTRVAPWVASELVILMVLAHGFVAEKQWARALAVWHPLVLVALAIIVLPARVVAAALIQQAPIIGAYMLVAYACMYRVPSIVRYYARLES